MNITSCCTNNTINSIKKACSNAGFFNGYNFVLMLGTYIATAINIVKNTMGVLVDTTIA
jgi:hypothetical protein